MQAGQELVVVLFHFLVPAAVFPYLLHALLAVRVGNQFLQICDIQIQRLHGIEKILCHRLLAAKLLVLIKCVTARSQSANNQDGYDLAVFPFLLGLYLRKSLANIHGVLAHRLAVPLLAEITLNILRHNGLTAGGPRVAYLSRNFLLQQAGFNLQPNFRPINSQPDRYGMRNRSAGHALVADKHAVAAVKIADTPDAFLQNHFDVGATDVVIRNADFALLHPSDAEGLGEVEISTLYRRSPDTDS